MKRRNTTKNANTCKLLKSEELCDKTTFYLTKCYIDNNLINYYNNSNLYCLNQTEAESSKYLRSHESNFTDKTPCLYDHHKFDGPSFGMPISLEMLEHQPPDQVSCSCSLPGDQNAVEPFCMLLRQAGVGKAMLRLNHA